MSNSNVTLAGVDVFVEAPLNVQLPPSIGSLNLKHVASRGLKLTPSASSSVLDVGWLCARYVFAKPVTGSGDNEIAELLIALGKDYRWTSAVKLFDVDGKPTYS